MADDGSTASVVAELINGENSHYSQRDGRHDHRDRDHLRAGGELDHGTRVRNKVCRLHPACADLGFGCEP